MQLSKQLDQIREAHERRSRSARFKVGAQFCPGGVTNRPHQRRQLVDQDASDLLGRFCPNIFEQIPLCLLNRATERLLMRDRFAAGEQTPVEWALTVVYHDNYLRIQREMLASLPEQEREYRPDTRYGQWRALIDQYCCSEANLEDQLLETFFSPEFRAAYAPIRAAAEARAAEFFAPGPPPPPEPPNYRVVYVLGGLALVVVGFVGAGRGGYGRRRGD